MFVEIGMGADLKNLGLAHYSCHSSNDTVHDQQVISGIRCIRNTRVWHLLNMLLVAISNKLEKPEKCSHLIGIKTP